MLLFWQACVGLHRSRRCMLWRDTGSWSLDCDGNGERALELQPASLELTSKHGPGRSGARHHLPSSPEGLKAATTGQAGTAGKQTAKRQPHSVMEPGMTFGDGTARASQSHQHIDSPGTNRALTRIWATGYGVC